MRVVSYEAREEIQHDIARKRYSDRVLDSQLAFSSMEIVVPAEKIVHHMVQNLGHLR